LARFRCATRALRTRGETARGKEIADCKLQIADCEATRFLPSIFNFQFSIFNIQFLLVLLFLAAPAAAQVQLPEPGNTAPIRVTAQAGNGWQSGSFEIWVLRGDCVIQQGKAVARCAEAVLWIDRAPATEMRQSKVIAYLEGNVEIAFDTSDARPNAPKLKDQAWFGRFNSSASVEVRATAAAGKPDVLPPLYWRGEARRNPESAAGGGQPEARQAQFTRPPTAPAPAAGTVSAGPSPAFPASRPGMAPTIVAAPPGARRVRVFPRSDAPMQFQGWRQPDPNRNQSIAVVESGVTVVVEGLSVAGLGDLGTIDISADRLVIWSSSTDKPDLGGLTVQDERVPLELYAEGNIVFREGERTIYADRMYYDVPNRVGTVLNADILTPARTYEGLVRLHADVVQQTAQDRYFAQNAFFTSSMMGSPGYRLQAGDIYYEDIQQTMIDPLSGQPVINPNTGLPAVEHQQLATASNDFVFIESVPIFYWPMISTDLTDPTFYIRSARIRQDNVYGTQILTNWNGYQLLGIRDKPKGTKFDVDLDYLGKRGFGYGASFLYDRPDMFGSPGRMAGLASFWGIQDQGLDNLGRGRSQLEPEKPYRQRLFWQHRDMLPYDLQFSAEVGWISDRNFLEEYYKSEWEQLKDESTGLELKRIDGDSSLSLSADYRLNLFFTQTNWLPRADHFWLGQPLFGDVFTWYEHSNAAYAQFNELQRPKNPNDLPFNNLPWEASSPQGARLATRQEIDWPFQFGVMKVVPYLMGEAAYWGEDVNGEQLNRLWGQAGVRASVPIWSVNPSINSELFNVHGLAHKVTFEAEFSAADANRDLTSLPLYDALDDDSVEAFRRHFLTNTFGIPSYSPVPIGTPWPALGTKFDERFYALRTGLQNWVSSPSTEIADDLMAVRLGANQRWQTKRGRPDNRHIIDWMTLDTDVTFYPEAKRDNSGTPIGLFDYNYAWHVGDRLTLISSGIFDFFDQGQKIVTVGGFLTRPPRGSLYAAFTVLEGPLDSKVLALSYTYLMSPKWASSYGTAIDFGAQRSYSQNFSLTRIGESLLVNFVFTFDPARDSIGVGLAVEPRFLPKGRLGNVGGAQIPPAGAFGLE
jgi:hypothetical protein